MSGFISQGHSRDSLELVASLGNAHTSPEENWSVCGYALEGRDLENVGQSFCSYNVTIEPVPVPLITWINATPENNLSGSADNFTFNVSVDIEVNQCTLHLVESSNITIPSSTAIYGKDAIRTSDGGYLVSSVFNLQNVVFKLNSSYDIQWNVTMGGSGFEVPVKMIELSSNEILIGGHTTSSGAGSWDFWITRMNSTGGIIANYTYGDR